jgi:NAD(P)H-hydrate repair Nnr-like enzyme with NAD(P)H-hydrate dehydratase domain
MAVRTRLEVLASLARFDDVSLLSKSSSNLWMTGYRPAFCVHPVENPRSRRSDNAIVAGRAVIGGGSSPGSRPWVSAMVR